MLLDGVDLASKTASFMRKDLNFASKASEEIFNLMLDEIVLGLCFDIHKTIKTGLYSNFLYGNVLIIIVILGTYSVTQLTAEDSPPIPIAGKVIGT